MKEKGEDPIDIVVMWVDGSDPEWLKEKTKYSAESNADASIYRYRDWGLLRYWFRGVETFAPWVRKIHFVTWGHIPEWLDVENPKLNIVKHEDFIPHEYLPTFSANTIENNVHRIKGLAEKFILMNDDFYFVNMSTSRDFFDGEIPMDTVALNAACPQRSLISRYFDINNTAVINDHFNFKESLKKNKFKWYNLKNGKEIIRTIVLAHCPRFPGFYQHHLASAFRKSTFEEVWASEPELLQRTCSHKFRESTDVNQWLFKDWQIAKGDFKIRSHRFGRAFYIDRDGLNNKYDITGYIRKQKGKMIAINDGEMDEDAFEQFMEELIEVFDRILPNRSSFERCSIIASGEKEEKI